MAAPVASWNLVRLYGTWRGMDGALKAGTYKVTVPARITNATNDAIIPAGLFAQGTLQTDVAGSPSLDLLVPSTDDPDNAETGWKLNVEVSFTGANGEVYVLDVPVANRPLADGGNGIGVNLRTVALAQSIPQQVALYKVGVPGGLAKLDELGNVVDSDGNPVGGGGGGPVASTSITDATTVGRALITASSATAGRDAIGAGTSSLALGVGSTTAKAGDWKPLLADLPAAVQTSLGKADTALQSDTAARARANHTGTQSSATIIDFTEAVQDAVGTLLQGASGVGVTYDDAANSLVITGAGAAGIDAETARDVIGVALVGMGNISVTANDGADTITISTSATVNATDAALRDRATHTGTQSADTLTDGATNKAFLATERTKLTGVATGATANATDAQLRDRSTHTGTQTSATISDFTEAAQDAINALLVGASGVTLSYNDAANTLTITGPGASGLDAEAVRDAIGVALVGAGLISIAVNDAADTITITTTATANDTNAALRDRTTHTGLMGTDGLPAGSMVAFPAPPSAPNTNTSTARPTSRTDLCVVWRTTVTPTNALNGDQILYVTV